MARKPKQKSTASKSASAGTGKNTGRTRHSKSTKPGVTIDLEATDVKKAETAASPRRSVPSSKPAGDDTAKSASASSKAASNEKPAETQKPSTGSKPATASSTNQTTKASDTSGKNETKSASPSSSTSSTGAAGKAASAKPTPASKSAKSGTGSTLLAACIGGVVALGLAGLLQYAGILGAPGSSQNAEATAQLETRIAGLEERLENQPPAATDETAVAALVDEKLTAASTASSERVTQLSADLAQLRDRLSALPAATSTDAALTAQIAQLSQDVAALKQDGVPASGEPSTNENGASAERVDALTRALSEIETSVSNRIATLQENLASTNAGQGEIKTRIDQTSATLDEINATAQQTRAKIAALQDRVENGADRRAAAAIAAAALKSDIDNGSAFETSLANLKAFAPDRAELQNLESFAQKGVPTVTQLTADFENTVSDAIIAATAPEGDGSMASRLAATARSLVKVEPIGVVEGETPQARVSQIAAALKKGDLSTASDAWSALPDPGKEASQSWHDDLQARLTANTVVSGTIETILNSSRGG